MVSFGFAGRDYLAISIEARKENGEGYSTLDGFFRHFELFYVVGDERDLIGVRAIHRNDPPEDVYLYRLQGSPEAGRRLFLEYFRQINSLRERPEFYNSLTRLHQHDLDERAREPPACAFLVEDRAERARAGVHVREGSPRHELAVRGATRAWTRQRARARGGDRGGLLAADPGGSARGGRAAPGP
jgi:hypothetical protein